MRADTLDGPASGYGPEGAIEESKATEGFRSARSFCQMIHRLSSPALTDSEAAQQSTVTGDGFESSLRSPSSLVKSSSRKEGNTARVNATQLSEFICMNGEYIRVRCTAASASAFFLASVLRCTANQR